jgi:hypothetical protein
MVLRGYWFEAQYNRGFGKVSIGDSRARVAEAMGEAGQESGCRSDGERASGPCTVALSYGVAPFFEVWRFELGADGRVVSKVHEDLD